MLSVSSLIEFLLSLLRSETAQAEFVADPEGMLARHGLNGLCGQDVRDVAPMVADHAAVHAKDPGSHDHGGRHGPDDPVGEIRHITEHYEVNNVVVHESDQYNLHYVDDRDTIVTVDDRDTTTIHADGDVTITDSFNEDNDVTVVHDSFNQDNDGVDNKDGTINNSATAGDDIDDSFNSNDTTIDDSFNPDTTTLDTPDDHDTTQTPTEDPHHHDHDYHHDPTHHDTTEEHTPA